MNTTQVATVLRQHIALDLRDGQGCVCVCDRYTPMTESEHVYHVAAEVARASQLGAPSGPDRWLLPAEEIVGEHIGHLATFPVPGLGDEGGSGDVTGVLVAVETWAPANPNLVELTVRDLATGLLHRPYQVKPGTWVELTPA